jgi:hypothetical protein
MSAEIHKKASAAIPDILLRIESATTASKLAAIIIITA